MGNSHSWKITAADAGKRLDKFLAESLPEVSRSSIQQYIKDQQATVEGRGEKPGYRLKVKDAVALTIPEPKREQGLTATRLTFPVLFEDDDLIVVNKPAGLAVHPGAGRETETVVSALLGHTSLSSIGLPIRPGVIHRLDKGTTGVLVLAKTDAAHKKLAKAFAGRRVKKEYLAIVQGVVKEDRGTVDVAIERDRLQRKRMKGTSQQKGRNAISHFEVRERFAAATLVSVRIETGRTHQIRVHLAFIGHPLLGDVLYGGSRFQGAGVHYLHSWKLGFPHPISGEAVAFEAPLPEAFSQMLKTLLPAKPAR